jgi:hypothetical protein
MIVAGVALGAGFAVLAPTISIANSSSSPNFFLGYYTVSIIVEWCIFASMVAVISRQAPKSGSSASLGVSGGTSKPTRLATNTATNSGTQSKPENSTSRGDDETREIALTVEDKTEAALP